MKLPPRKGLSPWLKRVDYISSPTFCRATFRRVCLCITTSHGEDGGADDKGSVGSMVDYQCQSWHK